MIVYTEFKVMVKRTDEHSPIVYKIYKTKKSGEKKVDYLLTHCPWLERVYMVKSSLLDCGNTKETEIYE